MKIELDLTNLCTEEGVRAGRCAAVLILAMLPEDEARLAMQQWAAWRQAEIDADRRASEPAIDEEKIAAADKQRKTHYISILEPPPVPCANCGTTSDDQLERWQTADGRILCKACAESLGEAPGAAPKALDTKPPAKKPSYERFNYGNSSFSIRKGGPSSALKQAFLDILGADAEELLGPLSIRLSWLKGIFEEIDRHDLVQQVEKAFEDRKAELAGVKDAPKAEAAAAPLEEEPQLEQAASPPASEARPSVAQSLNGDAEPADPETLRPLLDSAAEELGVDRVKKILRKHGARKLKELADDKVPLVRAEVIEAMAEL